MALTLLSGTQQHVLPVVMLCQTSETGQLLIPGAVNQVYMQKLQDLLARRTGSSDDAAIVELAAQACRYTYLKALFKPASMRRIINFDGQGLGPDGKKQVASRVLEALKLSCAQRDDLLRIRRLFLATQQQLLVTRQQHMVSLKVSNEASAGVLTDAIAFVSLPELNQACKQPCEHLLA